MAYITDLGGRILNQRHPYNINSPRLTPGSVSRNDFIAADKSPIYPLPMTSGELVLRISRQCCAVIEGFEAIDRVVKHHIAKW